MCGAVGPCVFVYVCVCFVCGLRGTRFGGLTTVRDMFSDIETEFRAIAHKCIGAENFNTFQICGCAERYMWREHCVF